MSEELPRHVVEAAARKACRDAMSEEAGPMVEWECRNYYDDEWRPHSDPSMTIRDFRARVEGGDWLTPGEARAELRAAALHALEFAWLWAETQDDDPHELIAGIQDRISKSDAILADLLKGTDQ